MQTDRNNIFIIAGLPRTGTTFLYHNLQKHPSIFVSYRKEIGFFIYYYDKGEQWYLNHFKDLRKDQKILDVSSIYLLHEFSIRNIIEFNPDAKLIVGVRDPVEFALSLHAQAVSYSILTPPFKDFIYNYSFDRINSKMQFAIADNFIPRTLESVCNSFGSNLMLYNYRLFKKDPLLILRAIEKFTDIPPYYTEKNFDNIIINAGNRRQIRSIASLLVTGDLLPRILRLLLPANFIRYVTGKKWILSGRKDPVKLQSYPPEDVKLAETVLADQCDYYNNFFSESDIRLGSGEAFFIEGNNSQQS